MDEIRITQTAELLKVIAHPTRLKILLLLASQGPLNVTALREQLQTEQSSMSHHLGKMKDKGVLLCQRKSKEMHYEVNDWLLTGLTQLFSKGLGKNNP